MAVEGWKGYFPLAHPGGGNFDEKVFKRQLKKILDLPCDKIFHNAIYDIGWLSAMGLEVKGRIIDTMIAAPLIDENKRNYSLKEIAQEYIGETKSEAGLYEAAKTLVLMQKQKCICSRLCTLVHMPSKMSQLH